MINFQCSSGFSASLLLCDFLNLSNNKSLYHSVYYLIFLQQNILHCIIFFCVRGWPIMFSSSDSFFIYCIVIKQVRKSFQYFYLLLAFCKMEFCFYLEKQWSGQNLTNRTICYGLVHADVVIQQKVSCQKKFQRYSLCSSRIQPVRRTKTAVLDRTVLVKKKLQNTNYRECGRHVPGFLKLILCRSSVCVFMCVHVCMCVSAPEAINSQWHDVA